MTAYRYTQAALAELPHCADITRQYCNRFSGILLVDGKYLEVKGYEKKIPVLYGIDYLTHDIPTYILSRAENYDTCKALFTALRLLKYPLQGLVCDDNVNIYQACEYIYPKVVVQLCLTHYKRNLRKNLDVNHNEYYARFMQEITLLFAKKRSVHEFNVHATRIWKYYQQDEILRGVLTEIQRRLPFLCSHWQNHDMPQTNNLIESFNSHLQGRLETIKGFESFEHADQWLNGYFLRRRLKPFTDCQKKFKHLNGTSSLQQSSTLIGILPPLFNP